MSSATCLAVIFLEQLRVNLLLGRFELCAHIILFANENELPRRRMIFVLEEVMHAQPEILQAEFTKVFAGDRERIEIVLFEILPKLTLPLFVFSPEKPIAKNSSETTIEATMLILSSFCSALIIREASLSHTQSI